MDNTLFYKPFNVIKYTNLFYWRNIDYIFVVQFLRMILKSGTVNNNIRGYNEQKIEVRLGTKPLKNSMGMTV